MKQYLKVALILFLISAIAAVLLSTVNSITAPRIAANIARDTEKALSSVADGHTLGEKREGEGNVKYTIPLSDNGKIVGYIVEVSDNGYGGVFSLVASYKTSGELINAKMMSNSETPGLGKKSEMAWYMEMFQGLGGDKPLPRKKADLPSDKAAAVSGASITFGGVTRALNAGSAYVKTLGGR